MSSFFDSASLVQIPSGYSDGTLYSVKPIDGTGDLTFSRGSDIEATRVASNGYIQKAAVNLLLQSNTFSNASWSKVNVTATGGQAGYDGSNDAWLIEGTGSSVFSYLLQSDGTASVKTRSVYAKAGTVPYLGIWGAGSNLGYFDLSDGSLDSISGSFAITHSITSVGGGWYRCEFTTTGSAANVYLVPSSTANGTILSAGENIYIQDAQLNYGLVAQEYVETTTTSVVSGITNDLPRLDYSGGASCPSLLLEPSKQNLIPQSEYYNASQWLRLRCTISNNTDETLSPEGVYNASKMVSTDAGESFAQDEGSITGTLATLSFFAKKGDTDFVHGTIWDNSANGCRQWFNVDSGAVGGDTAFGSGYSVVSGSEKIESFANGWYRCSFTANVTTGTNAFRMNLSSADETTGSPVNAYGYFYAVQAEEGSYPTSYIPTYGTSATRTADACSKTGISSLIGQTEGTLFAELKISANDSTFKFLSLSDGTTSNAVWIYYRDTDNQINFRVIVGGVSQFDQIYTSPDSTSTHKVAIKYKQNDFSAWFNGSKVLTDTSGNTFSGSTLSELDFFRPDGVNYFYGDIKQVLIFPTALTDAQLAELTA